MLIDLCIVLIYFAVIMTVALRGRVGDDVTGEEYFLSNRNLKWYSVAISTIATNVQGYQFLGMMGSAYLYGLAQGMFEINAMQGILMAAFIFVPLYLKDRVVTITQFIEKRLGRAVAVTYSAANIILLSTVGLGAALFWGAYAADLVFGEFFVFISDSRLVRTAVIVAALGIFSAIYTYFGGLGAVVRTDIVQFTILTVGGIVILLTAVHHLGGWQQLYVKTPELMHLHLPADHPKLPWTAMFGLALLNINYWCANQSVVQRSLAARSLRDAQIGLMAGGVMKYFMAIIIIVPGIALAGILAENPLAEPDQTFPYLVTTYLPVGVRGLILCALFASLMSTVDSLFNSIATLFSIDIYKGYLNKNATDRETVAAGRRTIIFVLCTGVVMGWILLNVKLSDTGAAFTHTLNELRYYINSGIVVTICATAFLLRPNHKLALLAFVSTIPLHLLFIHLYPEMNYIVRAGWVISLAFGILATVTLVQNGARNLPDFFRAADGRMAKIGWGLLLSLIVLHVIFH